MVNFVIITAIILGAALQLLPLASAVPLEPGNNVNGGKPNVTEAMFPAHSTTSLSAATWGAITNRSFFNVSLSAYEFYDKSP